MTNKIKNTIGIKTVILAGLIASFPYNVAGQHFYMERNIEELLYSCLCSEGIIDSVPQSGNTLLVYSDGITKVNMAHIEIFDLMTGEMGCRRAMKGNKRHIRILHYRAVSATDLRFPEIRGRIHRAEADKIR